MSVLPGGSGISYIRVTKDYLTFCAAHFISLEDGTSERLHGHNWRMGITLWGSLATRNQAGYVFDFVALKQLARRLTDELDHRILLAADNVALPLLTVGNDVQVEISPVQRYSFPASDVIQLPIPNTTAEMLARYFVGRIRSELPGDACRRLFALEVEIEETPGQSGFYREEWSV